MEIKKLPVQLLVENNWNPNFMAEKEFAALIRQINKHGMRQPILVRPNKKNYEIIDGAHRARASKKAGLKEIDCVVVELTDSQAKGATIAMNHLKGQMDDLSLAKLIDSLKQDLSDKELTDLSGLENKKVKILLSLLEFPDDFSKLVKQTEITEITVTFILTPKQQLFVEQTLRKIDAANKSFALLQLCKFYNKKANRKT